MSEISIPKFTKKVLNNGLEVYHIPCNEGSRVISVDLFYRVGSRNEIMGKSGIAHMLEHMNFKSTKTRKAGEFDRIVKGFGGVNNASTSFDCTHYFIKCESGNLATALDLYSDIMANLSLLDEEFQPERKVVYEERLWRTDNNPGGLLFFRLYNTAFLHHSYHWTPIGFKSDILNWTIEDIREFHAKFYQPKNAFLIVSGDIDENSVFSLAQKYFENIQNSEKIPISHITEPPQEGKREAIIYKDSEIEYLAMAYKIPPFKSADTLHLNAISRLLTNGKSSLLERVLVDEKMVANQVESYVMSGIDENLFIIFALCNPGICAQDLEAEIKEILNSISEISDDEIMKIKNSILSEFIYSFDSASKISSIFGEFILKSDPAELLGVEARIKQISKENLLKTTKKYFRDSNLTTIILKKEEKNEDEK